MTPFTYSSRLPKAKDIINRHFPAIGTDNLEEFIHIICISAHPPVAKDFVPVLKHKQKLKLEKLSQSLQEFSEDHDTPYWLKVEVAEVGERLAELASKKKLHGKQNTSNFEFKVMLVRRLRAMWLKQTSKAAPLTFQGETHPFSLFVADVLLEVCEQDFSPKSAIEAYKNLK